MRRVGTPALTQLLAASHPLASLAVSGVAGMFALATGRGLYGALLVATTILASQLAIGWQNDYLDRDRDRAAGRVDKPIAAGTITPDAVRAAAIVATGCFLALAGLHGAAAAAIGVIAFVAAAEYNRWAKRTVLSFAPFVVSFGLLPAFVTVGGDGTWPPLWIMATAALLGFAAHFANVLPDLDADRRLGVLGLPQRAGRGASTVIAASALGSASIVLGRSPAGGAPLAAAGALGAGLVVLFGRSVDRRRARLAFLAVVAIAALDTVLLILAGTGT